MKNFIYTTLLVFASLFCQAFGAQDGWLKFEDTICVKPGDIVNMSQYESQILELLQNREESIWSECCDVTVGFERNPEVEMDKTDYTGRDFVINKNKEVVVTVTYKRVLTCSNIPSEKKSNMPPASLAMWHLFGKLLSETDTEKVSTISDVATVTTLHQAKFYYNFELAFPEDTLSQLIKEREICSDNPPSLVILNLENRYHPYVVNWIAPEGIPVADLNSQAWIQNPSDKYFYPIICTATACKGETRSDTIFIGKPTPQPIMENINCIASSENSFVAKVKEADSRFSYHWTVEDLENNKIIDTQQGAAVTMQIPQNESVKLNLFSTGGCRASDVVTQVLHRSVVSGNIQLQGDTNCVFIGDTLRFVLQNAPQDSLVWKSDIGEETLLGNAEFICNTTGWNTTSFKVSVSNKNCPESIDSNTFKIRENFRVSIAPRDSCISAHTDYVFKASGNGINPIVEWYGYGVEIDTNIYKKEDSIRLKLTNAGGKNLYVAFKAKECGRESKDSLALHSKPDMPQLDTLWKNCIPLGIDTSIELRVQPQEGATFVWNFSENEKFYRVAKSDSPFIRVATNYALLDADRNIPIMVNVHAERDGCAGDIKTEYLSVFGAGLSEEWKIGSISQPNIVFTTLIVGFYQEEEAEIKTHREEFESFTFSWKCDIKPKGTGQTLSFMNNKIFPFNVTCLLKNNNTSCYSYYSATIEEKTTVSQSMVSSPSNSVSFGGTDGVSDVVYMNARPNDNSVDSVGIVLAPNPTQGNTLLYLGNTNIGEQTVIEIFTEQGVCLYRKTASANVEELPTARFQSGLYFVRVRIDEEEPVVKKLIVK